MEGIASAVPSFGRGAQVVRKLMWFTIGFGGACAFCAYFYWEYLWLMVLAGLLLSLSAWLAREKWKWMRCLVAVFLGFSVGIGWFSGYEVRKLSEPVSMDGTVAHLTVEACQYGEETEYGTSVEGRIHLESGWVGVKVYFNEELSLKPGDRVQASFLMRATHGGSQEETFHRGDGTLLLCYQRSKAVVEPADHVPLRHYPAMIRQNLLDRIDRTFPGDVAFFAKALLLGDRSGVNYELNTDFKVSGISHIIAVSGLHVSILFAVVYLISGRRKVLTAVIGMPLILLFAAVAGFTPSITRACIMQILMLAAMLFDKEYDPPTSLSFAALVMLVAEPLVITSVSFQLSVGCMAGIFLFSRRISGWLAGLPLWKDKKGKTLVVRLRKAISGGVGITLSAMFFTTPLVAYYFGAVSLIGIVTNLLTLWAVSLIFYGIMAVCLVSLIWEGAAAVLAWLVAWPIRYVLNVVALLADVPVAAVYTSSVYVVLWLVGCYLLFGAFMLMKKRSPFLLIGCYVTGLCLSLILSWAEPLMSNYRITIFDVGQGQCVLLQADGRSFLVDCGGDYDSDAADLASETLLSMGIQKLDGLVVTHYDRDHAGGVAGLLSRVPAEAVFLPDGEDEEILPEILAQCRGTQVFLRDDLTMEWSDNAMTIFAPVSKKSGNESGLSVLFRAGNYDILITGDLSTTAENILVDRKGLQDMDALVVGHHGSKSSTGTKLLETIRPEFAFISVGADNSYGHPSDQVLKRLEEFGCQIYRTDEDGTIIIRG